ncbi:MAG: 3,4-dihydroxy-2-butanone-4-phosphate synthase [Candidatus Micrarchaeota archaeon]|nr:3,4-dihydroxy-2-butanone-4-phosphate synthase [Candidatus Micrarchaeota archaeon]
MNKTLSELKKIKKGIPILIYEADEDELSIGILAEKLTKKKLILMKKFATSDVSVVLPMQFAEKINLPYLHKLIENDRLPFKKKRSSLTLLLDHKDAITGSRDEDKLLLIKEFAKTAKNKKYKELRSKLIVPGHLKFFVGRKGLLNERMGHTELFISAAMLAGIKVEHALFVIATLRDPHTGKIIKSKDLKRYDVLKDLPLLSAEEIKVEWMNKYDKRNDFA